MKYTCCMCGKDTDNEEEMCDQCKTEYGYVEREKISNKPVKDNLDLEPKIISKTENEIKNQKPVQNANLMYCPDCGNQISKAALQCPHCGHPFKKEEEKIIKKNPAVKAICYITVVLGFCFVGGALIPLFWGIGFAIYCLGIDKSKYDISYYRSLRTETLICAIIMFVVNILSLAYFGKLIII